MVRAVPYLKLVEDEPSGTDKREVRQAVAAILRDVGDEVGARALIDLGWAGLESERRKPKAPA